MTCFFTDCFSQGTPLAKEVQSNCAMSTFTFGILTLKIQLMYVSDLTMSALVLVSVTGQ